MLASDILMRLQKDLHDMEGVRFTPSMLLEWLSDAQRMVVLLRPDANARTEIMELEAGATRQALPAGGVRFLGVLRNILPAAQGGTAPGRAVTLTTMTALNDGAPLWHTQGLSDIIFEYAPDEDTPTVFWVSPPPAAGVRVEIKYAAEPAELTRADQPVDVLPTFAEPLREYALYRAFSMNDQSGDFQGRANLHLQIFYTSIGEEQKARLLSSPLNELAPGGGVK